MKYKKTIIIVLLIIAFFLCLFLTVYNNRDRPININTCSQEALESLDGIGKVLSLRIIEKRPYEDIWQLDNVKGIGPGIINKIKNEVTCK